MYQIMYMQGIKSLNLAANRFRRLPAALPGLTSLQDLYTFGNLALELEPSDVDSLAALPHLKDLNLSKSYELNTMAEWSLASLGVWSTIKVRFAHVNVVGYP
jgi:hypothetical protein